MAVTVEEGKTYEAKDVRSGDNWTMFKVRAEKGPKEIAVFVDRGEAFHEGDSVTVTRIVSVKLGARKGRDRDGNEKWFDSFSVNVELSGDGKATFKDLDDDGDLPF